jgi:predicted SnoaL-like aldol condensation-catalyzing enzyme
MAVSVAQPAAERHELRVHRRAPRPPEITVVDIMRFEDGLIAEAWETTEPTTEAASHLTWWDAADH